MQEVLEFIVRNAIAQIREEQGIDINSTYPLNKGTKIIMNYLKSKGMPLDFWTVYYVLGTILGQQLKQDWEGGKVFPPSDEPNEY